MKESIKEDNVTKGYSVSLSDKQRQYLDSLYDELSRSDNLSGIVAMLAKQAGSWRINPDGSSYELAGAATTQRVDVGVSLRITVGPKSIQKQAEQRDAGAGGPPYCMTVTEICGIGMDDYIYCTYEVCVDAITSA